MYFTIVNHVARKELDLSIHEYCVADIIYHYSNNPSSKMYGWCYASKETLAKSLGLSVQSIHNIIKSLIENKLIEKDIETKYLKTTEKWYEKIVLKDTINNSKESLHTVKNLYSDSKETLHNIYNNNNNNIYKVKETKKIDKNTDSYNKFLNEYNKVFNRRIKSMEGWKKNAGFWLTIYSEDEILQAIRQIPSDSFWKDKMDLTILFRRKNPQGENVDYIQKLLTNIEDKKPKRFMIGGEL